MQERRSQHIKLTLFFWNFIPAWSFYGVLSWVLVGTLSLVGKFSVGHLRRRGGGNYAAKYASRQAGVRHAVVFQMRTYQQRQYNHKKTNTNTSKYVLYQAREIHAVIKWCHTIVIHLCYNKPAAWVGKMRNTHQTLIRGDVGGGGSQTESNSGVQYEWGLTRAHQTTENPNNYTKH